VHTDITRLLSITASFFKRMFCPGNVPKTGRYLPEERSPDFQYPWEDPSNPDPFRMCSTSWLGDTMSEADPPPGADPQKADVLALVLDRCTYQAQLKHISNNKQPGPDRIANELLKALPQEWHDTIHALFVIMWVTGETPSSWKTSTTTLLHKKNDALLLANFRPIALANALYKLWTSTVNHVSMHHALRYNIIHQAQEGGILGRNTHRQLRTLINAFEDAHLHHQDLFMLYVDFSSAFNLVDHDKLLCIMHDVGMPSDVIEVVKNLYQDASTVIHLPGGNTDPIAIERGTIQGDPLSPFLFLIYIEPLLRWLHVGGRGYKFGCLAGLPADPATGASIQQINHLAGAGFIDDTYAMTNTRADLGVQAAKIEAYSNWAGTPVNASKSATTAILHGEAHQHNRNPMDPDRLASLLQHKAAVVIAGNSVPFYSPTTPYPYLGVLCCPAMVWEAHLQQTMAKIRLRGSQLAGSLASVPNRIEAIQRCIKTSATYALSVAPFTVAEIAQLDQCIAQVSRQCCRLMRGSSTSGILRGRQEAGLGIISLDVDYAQISAANLTRALRDDGRLGLTTTALLNGQIAKMGGAPVEYLKTEEARYCTALRQLAILNQHKLDLMINGRPCSQTPPGSSPTCIWNLAHLLRANLVPPDILACLHELGVEHIGQLVTESGDHLITTADLARIYGAATTRHKVALNQLSVVVSGKLPSGVESIPRIRSTQALPADLRALPSTLRLDPANPGPTTARTLGMRGLTAAAFPSRGADTVAGQTIHVTCMNRTCPPGGVKASERHRQETAAKYDRQDIPLGSRVDMQPSQVLPGDHSTMHAFWQQRLDMMAHLRTNGSECHTRADHEKFWAATGLHPRMCTWEQFRDATLTCADPPIELLSSLYDEQFSVTTISGAQCYKGPAKRQVVKQYLVEWAPTIMCASHIAKCAAAYKNTVKDTTPLPHGDPSVVFLADAALVIVEWEPSYEPVGSTAISAEVRSRFEQQHTTGAAPKTAPTPPASDFELPDHYRQGLRPKPICALLAWATTLLVRQHVTLDPTERNPERDINPPGQYMVQIGLCTAGSAPSHTDTAYVYRPDGRCVGTLAVDRLRMLEELYHATREQYPDCHAKLATTFAQDLAQCMLRYRPGPDDADISKSAQWTCPDLLMTALVGSFGMTDERFSCPLDRSPLPKSYWTPHAEDSLFGANHDAFSVPWQGCSQAHPGPDAVSVDKALRWAIGSATVAGAPPTCTFLVVPAPGTDMYKKYLRQPEVTLLAHIDSLGDQSRYNFHPPNFWQGHPLSPLQGAAVPPKHTMLILAVANASGRAEFLNEARVAQFHQRWGRVPPAKLQVYLPKSPLLPTAVKNPRALDRLLTPDPNMLPLPTQRALMQCQPSMPGREPSLFPCTHTLKLSGADLTIFTDGSCIRHKDQPDSIGAAVFCVRPPGDARATIFKVNPNGKGYTSTITRAELSAILAALTTNGITRADETVHIFTDSLCSIHLIHRMLNSPHTLTECKHRDTLERIIWALKERAESGAHTYIYKVKSHAGCAGNNIVDKAAKEAALDDTHADQIIDTSDNDPYSHGTWVAAQPTQPAVAHPNASSPQDTEDGRTWSYLSNLNSAAKQILLPLWSAGSFSCKGVYAEAWHKALPCLDKVSSAYFWTAPNVTYKQRRLTFAARWGLLWNRKLAFRFKRAASPNCPLCGNPDSTGHMLGGCSHPDTIAMRIARHDEAVRILQRAIEKAPARDHRTMYTIMDAGPANNLPEGVSGKRLPAWLLPDLPDTDKLKMRPDLLIVTGLENPGDDAPPGDTWRGLLHQRAPATIHIIEVGYGNDTALADKDLEKREQQMALYNELTKPGNFPPQFVKYHTVPLGRCGAIPSSFRTVFRDLGLGSTEASICTCAKKLHVHAVHWIEKMYTHRQALDRRSVPGQAAPRPRNLNPLIPKQRLARTGPP